MRKYLFYFLFPGFLASGISCHAQKEALIANTTVRQQGEKIQISYDILNTDKEARFIVSLEIRDSKGKLLNTEALEGDVGEVASAGRNKRITWDPAADSIFLNESIDIQVVAEMILPPPVIVAVEPSGDERSEPVSDPKEQLAEEDQGLTEDNQSQKEYKMAGILLQSTAFPGLGLTRMTGKPHWIKGIAGYGSIAGAVIFNRKAISSYEDYKQAESHEQANTLFDQVNRQNRISKGFAFTAIAVWVTDLTWTIIYTSGSKGEKSSLAQKNISLGTDYDQFSGTPLLSFTYTF